MTKDELDKLEARANAGNGNNIFRSQTVRKLIAEVHRLQAELAQANAKLLRFDTPLNTRTPPVQEAK